MTKKFCFSPWTNIDISPQGDILPCCKFQRQYYNEKYNVQTQGIDEYLSSNFLKEIKHEMQQGQWPKGCERCQNEELNNIDSKRILDYQRWEQYYNIQPEKILTASIAFGNTCNLKCITCNSGSSSKWHQEYQEIYNIDRQPVHFYRNDFIEQVTNQMPDLIHLDIPGGEPFLSGVNEQLTLLDYYISADQAKNISLHYTTNVTVYPDQRWWDRWKHFREIDLQLSIDGINERYEYIRYPAKWSIIVPNVEKYLSVKESNFRLSVSHTVSAYNIFYLDEFVQWCYNQGLPRPWMGMVHNPPHMRPAVWPTNVRNIISTHLKESADPDVNVWADLILNTDDSNNWKSFKQYLEMHDQYRDIEFSSTFPELAEFIK